MKPEKRKPAGNAMRDKLCKMFLKEHTEIPNALFGDQMEREAYLDTLVTRFKNSAKTPDSQIPVVFTR